ncbi:MAG TPA: cytochrome c3 family protein [Thermoanaerobaculia bacterium]
MKPHATGVAALVLILGLPVVLAAQTPEQNPPPTTTAQPATATAPAPVAEAAASCSDCHDEAKVFRTNIHARGATVTNGVVANDVCTTCHGDGTEHIQAGGDKTKITKPAGRVGSDDVCMLCHDATTDRISRHGGMHANSAAVNCLTCHSIHHPDPRSAHLVAKPQLVLCASCHTQAAGFESKPYKHRLGRGGMECSSCHEPHGRPSSSVRSMAMLDPLRTTRAGEAPCLNCHADKRGPWVFSHGANAVGDCVSCHEVHGSSNPKQLKRANVWQLCIECHSPISNDTLGSQPPSFHNLSSPRYRNCTTCHVAIHGSNRDPQLLK